MKIKPKQIKGNWKDGFSLDFHTASSKKIDDSHYENLYTPIGFELYRLKYCDEYERVTSIAKDAVLFLQNYINEWVIDIIIPVPPSDLTRKRQPVIVLAENISKLLNLDIDIHNFKKIKDTKELKSEENPDRRKEILKDAFSVNNKLIGKNVLLIDDLYRSGETLNAITDVLYRKGKVNNVFVLTITKTRTKR